MTDWAASPERGAAWIVRLMMALIRRVPWFARRIVLPGITAWFFTLSPRARSASRGYLTVALRRPATTLDVLRHVHSFAVSILDRMMLLTGRAGDYAIEVHGLDHVQSLVECGRGGVLLGAHLGSFAVLRGLAARCPVPVKMLMYRANGGALSRVIDQLDPALATDTIQVGDVQSMLRAHDAVAAGALVGMLADRAPGGARPVSAPFFGRPADFAAGPFVLAASLGVPVLTFRAVRTGPRRYCITFAPFAERVILRRACRDADLAAIAARYAAWLEDGCRAHPFDWFNFYPFWDRAHDAPSHPRLAAAGRPRLGTTRSAAAG